MKITGHFFTFIILVLISLGYFATDIYLPSLPRLSDYFGASEGSVQLTLFSYLISFALSPLIFGPISDHYGRKKIIMLGVLISLGASIACIFSPNIHSLTAFRFIQGIGTGAVMIASRSMVADLYSGKELARQISYISMFMPFVLAIAPTIGGFLQEAFGWKAIFVFLIVYLCLIYLGTFLVDESLKTLGERPISQMISIYREVLENRAFMGFVYAMAIPSIGLFGYLTASPFIFQVIIGLTPSEYGMLSLATGGAIILASFVNARLLKHVSIDNLLYLGTFLIITAGILMLFFHYIGILNTWSVLIPALFFFCCVPLSLGNAASKAMFQVKRNFGAANGVLTTIQFLAGSLGSLIFSYIPENDAFPIGLCFTILGFMSLLNLRRLSSST